MRAGIVAGELVAAAEADGEFVTVGGRKELGDFAQAFGESAGGEEGIFAFAEVVVVNVVVEAEQVDGEGVGEGGFEEFGLGFFVNAGDAVGAFGEGVAAGVVGILRGLAFGVVLGLLPDEVGEFGRDSGVLDKGVADVDEEFKSQGEAIAHEAGGDEDHFRAGGIGVAMADGLVFELGGVVGDDGSVLVALGESEGDEVVGFAAEGAGDGGGNGLDESAEVGGVHAGVSEAGVEDAVGGLFDGGEAGDLCGGEWGGYGHETQFYLEMAGEWSAGKATRMEAMSGETEKNSAAEGSDGAEAAVNEAVMGNGGAGVVKPTKLLGIPVGDFGFFATLLVAASAAMLTFFAMTFLSIIGVSIYKGISGSGVSLAVSYKYIAFPTACVVLAVALVYLMTVWVRRKMRQSRAEA